MDIGNLVKPDSPNNKLVKKTVEHCYTGSDGEEVTENVEFHVKPLSFGDHLDMHKLIEAGVNDGVALISVAVLCGDGKVSLTPDQVRTLPPELIPLIIAEVEGVNQLKKKSSRLQKNSLTA